MRRQWLLALLLGALGLQAQEGLSHDPFYDHTHFRISAVLGHTFIPTETRTGETFLYIPSWGLDLEFWFNHHWGIGLHNDLEMETFEIIQGSDEFIERQYPLVITLDLLWMPGEHWVFLAGPGVEFETNRNLNVFRLGAEYEYPLHHHWDIAPAIYYDFRVGAFDTWSVGVGLAKSF